MAKGLYSSIFGAAGQGLYDSLYSDYGASPPVKRMDIRLGDYGEDEEEDDEEEEEASPAAAAPSPVMAAPTLPARGGFFSQDIGGFPLWLIGVGFLGFAWSYRRKRKKQSTRRK